MTFVREGVTVGGKELTMETGRMARQAGGSVVIRYGDSMVLVAATASHKPREGVDEEVEYTGKPASSGNPKYTKFPMVCLINGQSASARTTSKMPKTTKLIR